MLVRLTSSTSGKMIMFAEHAHDLFGWIGKECVAHGVFTMEQLPEAIARLRHGVEEEKRALKKTAEETLAKERDAANEADENDNDKKNKPREEAIPLGQRAQPLIRLMEWTSKEGGFIVWEAREDF